MNKVLAKPKTINGNREAIFPPHNVIRGFEKDLQGTMHEISNGLKGHKGFVSVFGSSRMKPADKDYQLAEETSYFLGKNGYGTISGGGTGIMEAANKGASEAKAPSIGVQPKFLGEREKADDIDGKLLYYVHSMYARKVAISANSAAIIALPGSFGTMDELFENLTLAQIGKNKGVPIILMGNEKYWKGLLAWLENHPLRLGLLSKKDFGRIRFASTYKQAAEILKDGSCGHPNHDHQELSKWFAEDLRLCHQEMCRHPHPSVSFFGSSKINQGSYFESALGLARELAEKGFTVYSGGGSGIMEAVAKGVLEAGRKAFGLIPSLFIAREKPDPEKSQLVKLNMMASRKLALGSSDSLVFYPGGFGTLDELFEFAVRIQIKDMEKVPIVLVHRGFWGPLYSWLEKYPVGLGLMDRQDLDILSIANRKEAVRIVVEWNANRAD